MKLARHGFCFVVLLLTLGVAAREFPESLSLVDDVSNDGELIACELEPVPGLGFAASISSTKQRRIVGERSIGHNLTCSTSASGLAPPTCVGPDLLYRLHLQRK